MRIAFILLVGIHAIIHLFGFLKSYGFAEFNAIIQPISKSSGLVWLITFLLFTVSIILLTIQNEFWWICGFLALLNSQILIFNYWEDAKFGTIVNVIILLAVVTAYSNYSFKHRIEKERIALLDNSNIASDKFVTKEEISDLPPVVQRWLTQSGVVGKLKVSNVYLTQELQLKLKPEQGKWNKATAEQYFSINPPAFNWNINTEISFLNVVGRDKFENGKGEMVIKLLSVIPLANARDNANVDQATLQRYLAEIVWFPSAALSSFIKWEAIDKLSARAILDYNGTKGSGVYHFDENGSFKKFSTMRYKGLDDVEPSEWSVTADKTEKRNGIEIPTECSVSWMLNNEKWIWLKLRIKSIKYDIAKVSKN